MVLCVFEKERNYGIIILPLITEHLALEIVLMKGLQRGVQMNNKKSYLVHEYNGKGEYIRAIAFDSRIDLVLYIAGRKMSYDKNKLSMLDDDLMTIKAKDGTGFVEIEELPDSACRKEVEVDGKKYVSLDEYCLSSGHTKSEVNKAIQEHALPCLMDVTTRKKYVDPDIHF